MEKKHTAAAGYLPEERPTRGKLLLYAIQQVIVMFACHWFSGIDDYFRQRTCHALLHFDHRAEDSAVLWLQLRLSDGDRQYVCGGGL